MTRKFCSKDRGHLNLKDLIAWLKAISNRRGGRSDRPNIYTADVVAPPAGGDRQSLRVTSEARLALAPDIPTFAEIGLPALSYSPWTGLFAPKATPKEIVGKLNAAAVEALADEGVRSRLVDLGHAIFPRDQQTPEALGVLVKAGAEKWWPIIKELGIKAQ